MQIFLLGDTQLLLSVIPRAPVGLLGLEDDIINDARASRSYLGDPVKNTMLLQAVRRFPIITAIPLIVTVILLVVDIICLVNPMVLRVLFAIPALSPIMAPFLADFDEELHEEPPNPGFSDGVNGILYEGDPRGGRAFFFEDVRLNSAYYNTVVLMIEKFPMAVHGTMQSPVDLSLDQAVFSSKFRSVSFQYSSTGSVPSLLSNTGFGWKVKIASSERNMIKGLGMSGNYFLGHYTMHWRRSEHTIDGEIYEKYLGELQLYHYHDQYPDWDQAVLQPGGVAVVAVLLKAGGDEHSTEIDKIVEYLSKIEVKGEEIIIKEKLEIDKMLSDNREFLFYGGSLTTPGFEESVAWVVMRQPVTVAARTIGAMNRLRYGKVKESPRMMNNCREQVMLGDRQVFTTWDGNLVVR